jgi:hypothetical protein
MCYTSTLDRSPFRRKEPALIDVCKCDCLFIFDIIITITTQNFENEESGAALELKSVA